MASYGKVYRSMIENGAKTIMAAHIDQPAWRYRLNPSLPKANVPATLSKELITGLLRGELGFNGLVITDVPGMKQKIAGEISGPPYPMGKPFLLKGGRL